MGSPKGPPHWSSRRWSATRLTLMRCPRRTSHLPWVVLGGGDGAGGQGCEKWAASSTTSQLPCGHTGARSAGAALRLPVITAAALQQHALAEPQTPLIRPTLMTVSAAASRPTAVTAGCSRSASRKQASRYGSFGMCSGLGSAAPPSTPYRGKGGRQGGKEGGAEAGRGRARVQGGAAAWAMLALIEERSKAWTGWQRPPSTDVTKTGKGQGQGLRSGLQPNLRLQPLPPTHTHSHPVRPRSWCCPTSSRHPPGSPPAPWPRSQGCGRGSTESTPAWSQSSRGQLPSGKAAQRAE